MYVNGKMIPVETTQGMAGGLEFTPSIHSRNGGSEFKHNIFDILQELL
jgi:hypothetical protein